MPNQATYMGLAAGAGGVAAATFAETSQLDPIVKAAGGVALVGAGWVMTRGQGGLVKVAGGTVAGTGGGLLASAAMDVLGL